MKLQEGAKGMEKEKAPEEIQDLKLQLKNLNEKVGKIVKEQEEFKAEVLEGIRLGGLGIAKLIEEKLSKGLQDLLDPTVFLQQVKEKNGT